MVAPQAVVKMIRNGGTRSPGALKKQLEYLSQNGAVRIEYPESLGGPQKALTSQKFDEKTKEWAEWTDKYEPGQEVNKDSSALTTHIVVSFPPESSPDLSYCVARNFASRMFDRPSRRTSFPAGAPEHRFPYFTAFHQDKEHPHLHIVINRRSTEGGWLKIANREGQRSNPRTPDMFTFADLRHELVDAAIEEGFDMEATTRLERGLGPMTMNDIEYRRFMETNAYPAWRAAAIAGDDGFIRVKNEIDDDGIELGEPEALRRGHTPEPEWAQHVPMPRQNEEVMPDRTPQNSRQSTEDHDDALAMQEGEAALFEAEDIENTAASESPRQSLAQEAVDAEMADIQAPSAPAETTNEQVERGSTQTTGNAIEPAPQSVAATERMPSHAAPEEEADDEEHRESLNRAKEQREREREKEAQAGPSRRRTPAGTINIERDDLNDNRSRTRKRLTAEEKRRKFGPPNVATRRFERSENTINQALLRLQAANNALENGVVTRAKLREVEEATKIWLQGEQAEQTARANPGRQKRKRDNADDVTNHAPQQPESEGNNIPEHGTASTGNRPNPSDKTHTRAKRRRVSDNDRER